MHRNRLTFAALCAIARRVLEPEPSLDDAEWKERIKCRIAREGRAYPTPVELDSALSAVEAARAKQGEHRPAPAIKTPLTPAEARDARPLSREEARAALATIARRLTVPPIKPREMPHATPDDERRAVWERQQTQRLQLVVEAADQSRARLAAANAGAPSARDLVVSHTPKSATGGRSED